MDAKRRIGRLVRRVLRWLLKWAYGFEAYGEEVAEVSGPVLLIPNHVSWVDWVFVGACLDDDWRFVTSSVVAETSFVHRWVMRNRRTFPIDIHSPYGARHMADYLKGGGRLVLFAEGRMSVTGTLMKLFEGTGFLLFKTDSKVITCYLRGANRLPWTRHAGWYRWFPKVTLHFSPIQTPPELGHVTTWRARKELTQWVYDRMVAQQFEVEMASSAPTVPEAVVDMAVQRPKHLVVEDMNNAPLSYRRLLAGADLLRQQWRWWLPQSLERVGVMLPNTRGTPVVLLSLWLEGRVPAILNFATGMATLLNSAKLAGLSYIITSREFVARAKLDLKPLEEMPLHLVFIEDVRERIPQVSQWGTFLKVWLNPRAVLQSAYKPEQTAVLLFTSGSEGQPKGVALSHRNLLANIRQMLAVVPVRDTERLFNALPLFHSFGLTLGTLLPLVRGLYTFLYPSPLHYRVIPNIVYSLDCTIMMGTNTFLNGYARKAHPYDFRSLQYLFAGAEKLQEGTFQKWVRQFGVRTLEGYGATECSPVISVNTPITPKIDSAGRLLPGMDYRVEPVEGVEDAGRLLVRGPNVMQGYLNPEADQKFQALDGWYDTGDIASVDDQGFFHILGRLKRFAKISGEMVSLAAIEEALDGAFPQYGFRLTIAIVTRHDEHKGEVLAAVANDSRLSLGEIRDVIKSKGFSNLCVPREVEFVRDIPRLSTGKIDHRALQQRKQD